MQLARPSSSSQHGYCSPALVMSSSCSGSYYSGFDSLPEAQDESKGNWRRRIVRSLSLRSGKNNPPGSTTSEQLRAATVRGELSACEEQVNIARAQRERDAIHYHADEAVKAGNVAAVIKDDQAYWIEYDSNYHPPLQKQKLSPEVINNRNQQPAASGSDNATQITSKTGSKKKMPWDAMQSVRSSFPSKASINRQEADKVDKNDSNIEEKVFQMQQQVLQESHNQSGALLLTEPTTQLDCKARARVKLIVETPAKAFAYIKMGLQNGYDMSQIIEMIDYYCA